MVIFGVVGIWKFFISKERVWPYKSDILVVNPRRACAARVTVVGLCVCMYVCSLYLPPHTLESQKRDTNRFITIREPFKILTSSSSGVLALFFSHEISFYASFEAYSYVFTAQTTSLWKTACDPLA